MDENIQGKIEQLLNDPKGMQKIQDMAQSLFGGKSSTGAPALSVPKEFGDIDVNSIMKIMNLLKNGGESNRANLLLALKPMLSDDRRNKVDSAVKLLKIIELLPILKEQGLLDNLI